jgi:peptidoglycan/xylan/chitin deacetylase (PgdA/CDA1 family)
MRGIGRIKRAARQLRRRFRPGAVILMYHRIIDCPDDPYGVYVSPANFAAHLKHLQQNYQTMRLVELVAALRQGALPQHAVALTFDDGKVDTYSEAYPYLASARIPATVFVTTGYVDRCCEFWDDKLQSLFLLPDCLPPHLQLDIRGVVYAWSITCTKDRRRVHGEIYELLKPLPAAEQADILNYLEQWAGNSQAERPNYRAMTSGELNQLACDGLVDLGAHTVTHPMLSAMPADIQRAEIEGSRQQLEQIIGRPVSTFAYPYGMPSDFNTTSIAITRAGGFFAACTWVARAVEPNADLFQLPRCWVGNWEPELFKRNIESYYLN